MKIWLRIVLICLPLPVMSAPPVADMHLHYKWSQQDVTSPSDAAAVLRQQGIVMGVVIGTPAELALELKQQAPGRVHSWGGGSRGSWWPRMHSWLRWPQWPLRVLVAAR